MAVNYGAYGAGASTRVYDNTNLSMPDLGAAWQEGVQYAQGQRAMQRREELERLNIAQKDIDVQKGQYEWDQFNLQMDELDNKFQEQKMLAVNDANQQYSDLIKVEGAVLAGAPTKEEFVQDYLKKYGLDGDNVSDKKKKVVTAGLQAGRQYINDTINAANDFLDSGIDTTDPRNAEMAKIAHNAETARLSEPKFITDKKGNELMVHDIIINVDGEDVVIPNGDYEQFFKNQHQGASISNIDNQLSANSFFKNLAADKNVNAGSLDGLRPGFNQLFQPTQGEDGTTIPAKMSLESFNKYLGDHGKTLTDVDGDGDVDINDAWETYKTIKEEGARSIGRWGTTLGRQSDILSLRKSRKDLETPTGTGGGQKRTAAQINTADEQNASIRKFNAYAKSGDYSELTFLKTPAGTIEKAGKDDDGYFIQFTNEEEDEARYFETKAAFDKALRNLLEIKASGKAYEKYLKK